jgi:NitT/TauT family transport system substrate-binding protein
MRSLVVLILAVAGSLSLWLPAGAQTTKLKIATCARTITAGLGAPFAVATKMGWFKAEGIEVEIVPLPGSTDCVKTIATKDVLVALPSVEPLAILRPQGVKAKFFYTAYQTNTYGIAVPADSPIQKHSDLKGKTIGVTNMSSAGVIIARAQAAAAGLNPDTDITIVVAGEGAQPAVMLKNKQVDALSQFDTQYALTEIAGVKLRLLDTSAIARHPANGFIALEETIKNQRKELIGLGRAYAKGEVFAIANPEAAVRLVYEVFPQTKPTGKDEATAIKDDTKVIQARITNWKLDKAGVKRWGENSEANYQAYADFMLKTGIIKQAVTAKELVTNELIDDINHFDAEKIATEARAYRAGG